jgi:hypothetical protein
LKHIGKVAEARGQESLHNNHDLNSAHPPFHKILYFLIQEPLKNLKKRVDIYIPFIKLNRNVYSIYFSSQNSNLKKKPRIRPSKGQAQPLMRARWARPGDSEKPKLSKAR